MDLGIRGKTALVCAASKGLGRGCAASLAAEGVNLVITARGREALEATAAELRERFGIQVTAVPGDIATEEGRQAALRACAAPDILVNNAGLSRKTVRHNVTINNLLPGPFDTDRLRSNFQFNAKASGKSYEELRKARAEANPAGRFGSIEEFGDACAYLCSAQAGYITGQNLLMDGGAYPGTF